MQLIAVGLVGICFGVVLASLKVPQIRWVPLVCVSLLVVVAVAMFHQVATISLVDGLFFVLSVAISTSLYAGAMWKRESVDPSLGYWEWVIRDLTQPSYGRRVHESVSPRPEGHEHEGQRQPAS
ncbi:hypothetical protein IWX64_003349 [Arthrobacter sp. CAN_A212]